MDLAIDFEEEKPSGQPSPANFNVFLPWACQALQMPQALLISKVIDNRFVSVIGFSSLKKKKDKSKLAKVDLAPDPNKDWSFSLPKALLSELLPGITICASYDPVGNLIKICFENNNPLPRLIFKIIGLVIHFYYYLNTISVNRGLTKYCIYEISKFLPFSRITDLCLDNSYVEEANFYLLLEERNVLRHLSLARCSINDAAVEKIAATLVCPMPSSKTLSILNLSSNKITDLGAKHLGDTLRSNRKLNYLNLSGNMLTDTGAEYLLDSLLKFQLTPNELLSSRLRYMKYLKNMKEMIIRLVKELRSTDFEKRSTKRKSANPTKLPVTSKKKNMEKEGSLKSVPETKSLTNIDAIFIDKATSVAENTLGEFTDPFDKANTFIVDGVVYSEGNNSLAYLSLAYNNLGYMTIKKLLDVLMYQKEMGRRPKGLINVSIEGNLMPRTCRELLQIDGLLEMGLMVHSRRYSVTKKRGQGKTGSGGTR